jgi:uncharacterized membrane protein
MRVCHSRAFEAAAAAPVQEGSRRRRSSRGEGVQPIRRATRRVRDPDRAEPKPMTAVSMSSLNRSFGYLRAGLLGLVLAAAAAGPASADLRMCNMTPSRVGVSLGYQDAQGWVTEGWWNLNARSCETLLQGRLSSRFYYIHAIDYDRGGDWGGRSFLCTRDREFTIRGPEDCLARGYDRTGFFEVDTGQQESWTIQLTDSNRPGGP